MFLLPFFFLTSSFFFVLCRVNLLPGFPVSTLSVLLVTYCGVQLVKEQERKQALLDESEAAKQKAE